MLAFFSFFLLINVLLNDNIKRISITIVAFNNTYSLYLTLDSPSVEGSSPGKPLNANHFYHLHLYMWAVQFYACS